MSACESRMSPSRGGSYLASSGLLVILRSVARTSLSEMRPPVRTLNTPPATLGASQASRLAWAALSTNEKSRVCSPSQKTTSLVSSRNAVQYLASTPEYGELGSWRGPKILEERRQPV